jgi:hypothetical protein
VLFVKISNLNLICHLNISLLLFQSINCLDHFSVFVSQFFREIFQFSLMQLLTFSQKSLVFFVQIVQKLVVLSAHSVQSLLVLITVVLSLSCELIQLALMIFITVSLLLNFFLSLRRVIFIDLVDILLVLLLFCCVLGV